jgi:hypothetical protein
MKTILSRLINTATLLTASALLAGAAHAGELTLYTDDNFGGRSVTLGGTTPDLVRNGFNDRTSSVVVRSGTWELCQDADFRGRCIVLQRGEYRKLEGFNDRVSSAREVGDRDRGDHGGRGDRGDRGDRGPQEPIVLFAQARFGGRHVEPRGDVRRLDDYDFNDKTGSVIINDGRWELCDDADFRGHCITLNPGRYDFLDDMNNRISSVRRVR